MFDIKFNFSVGRSGVQAAAGDTGLSSGVSRSTTEGWLTKLFGGGKTLAGPRVNSDTALTISAVYRAVKIRSQTVGMLPLVMYKRKPGGGRERATKHPLYKLFKSGPNAQHTAFNFKRAMQANLDTRGNAYALIERGGNGVVTALRPLRADLVTVRRNADTGDLFYDIAGGDQGIPARRMLHLRGFTLDGDLGLSPVGLAREGLALALATEQAGAEAFGKGVIPPMIISVKGNPDKEQRQNYRDGWVEMQAGQRNAPAVVGEMVKAEVIPLNLEDMQFLASRKFQNTEVARWFDIPPHMLFELDRATFSNIEHQAIEFLLYCMQPQFTNWEEEMSKALLTPEEQEEYYFEFMTEALLRTDIKTRWEAWKLQRDAGAVNANEIRNAENREEYEGGNAFLEPSNMRRVGPGANEGNPSDAGNDNSGSDPQPPPVRGPREARLSA